MGSFPTRSCGRLIQIYRTSWGTNQVVDVKTGLLHCCPNSSQHRVKRCRSCGEPIRFIRNGCGWQPVDAENGVLHVCRSPVDWEKRNGVTL